MPLKEKPKIMLEEFEDLLNFTTEEEAVLFVTETNLRQRSFTDLSHSERAYCLMEHYEAMKKQGKRSDIIVEIKNLLEADEM